MQVRVKQANETVFWRAGTGVHSGMGTTLLPCSFRATYNRHHWRQLRVRFLTAKLTHQISEHHREEMACRRWQDHQAMRAPIRRKTSLPVR